MLKSKCTLFSFIFTLLTLVGVLFCVRRPPLPGSLIFYMVFLHSLRSARAFMPWLIQPPYRLRINQGSTCKDQSLQTA